MLGESALKLLCSTCALDGSGNIECWGLDQDGQVSNTPSASGYIAVDAGLYFNCALNSSQIIECWGEDDYG